MAISGRKSRINLTVSLHPKPDLNRIDHGVLRLGSGSFRRAEQRLHLIAIGHFPDDRDGFAVRMLEDPVAAGELREQGLVPAGQ